MPSCQVGHEYSGLFGLGREGVFTHDAPALSTFAHYRFRCLRRGEDGQSCDQVVARADRAHHIESECIDRLEDCRCGEVCIQQRMSYTRSGCGY